MEKPNIPIKEVFSPENILQYIDLSKNKTDNNETPIKNEVSVLSDLPVNKSAKVYDLKVPVKGFWEEELPENINNNKIFDYVNDLENTEYFPIPLSKKLPKRVSAQYIKHLMNFFDDDIEKVIAAYNAGEGRVSSLIKTYGDDWKKHLPKETKEYIKIVPIYAEMFEKIEEGI